MKIGGYSALAKAFETSARRDAFAPDALAEYQVAWRQPGALTAMLNWHRALFLQDIAVPPTETLQTPVFVIWGDRDPFARPELADQSAELCVTARVMHLPDATHWILRDEPETLRDTLIGFLQGRTSVDAGKSGRDKPGSSPETAMTAARKS